MNAKAKRILIYIAHPTVLAVTAFRLRLLGIDVTEVRSSQEFSDALTAGLPDAVIVDLDLEMAEGMRSVEQISADECTSHIPILCLSSRGDLTEVENAFKAGARSFLLSPYDPVVLEDKLTELLDGLVAGAQSPSGRP